MVNSVKLNYSGALRQHMGFTPIVCKDKDKIYITNTQLGFRSGQYEERGREKDSEEL